jgi:AraC-like DNA-binding protein
MRKDEMKSGVLAGQVPHWFLELLRRALHRDDLPAPRWLLRWLVALRAVSLHRRGEMKLWRTAHELGYGSTEALSRRIKRLTGRPPRELSVEDLLQLLRDRSDSGETWGDPSRACRATRNRSRLTHPEIRVKAGRNG